MLLFKSIPVFDERYLTVPFELSVIIFPALSTFKNVFLLSIIIFGLCSYILLLSESMLICVTVLPYLSIVKYSLEFKVPSAFVKNVPSFKGSEKSFLRNRVGNPFTSNILLSDVFVPSSLFIFTLFLEFTNTFICFPAIAFTRTPFESIISLVSLIKKKGILTLFVRPSIISLLKFNTFPALFLLTILKPSTATNLVTVFSIIATPDTPFIIFSFLVVNCFNTKQLVPYAVSIVYQLYGI